MTGCSYPWSYFRGDVLYAHYRFRELGLTFPKTADGRTRVNDALAADLLKAGRITGEQMADYTARLQVRFLVAGAFDDMTPMEIYRQAHMLRREIFGAQVLEDARQWSAPFAPSWGQWDLKDRLVGASRNLLLVITDTALLPWLRKDLEQAGICRCQVLTAQEPGMLLPTRQALEGRLPPDTRFLTWGGELPEDPILFYGEEGLTECVNLAVDAAVYARPRGYYAQAVTNTLGDPGDCLVYIPAGMDITKTVPLTRKTVLSYRHLALLQKAYGEGIYGMSTEELYKNYPQYFLDIYESGPRCAGAEADYPIRVPAGTAPYEARREQALAAYLDGIDTVRYEAAYFDGELNRQPICYDDSRKQPGILVHTVRIPQAKDARVVSCDTSPRRFFAGDERPAIVSNFLFFLTPRLGLLYNDLRADRPREQADAASGHLDYMLSNRDGLRRETFPLFRKACIAKKEDGQFLFFNFRLGGGTVTVSGIPYSWGPEQVDRECDGPVRVYTPYYSLSDGDGDRDTYRKIVGAGRVNLVILQDKLRAVRRGDVVLPSVGVVISLSEEAARPLLERLSPVEDGYYDVSGAELTVRLDPPAGIDPAEWAGVQWAYGGGMSLIREGVALTDGGSTEEWFAQEGWMSPLSRQTQESALHTMVKHPRTAIGATRDGSLVILAFSGRTWRSTGADYDQMCRIARSLYPDIHMLMNVDGGGSAMLGLVAGGSFQELSCPSTSTGSTVGMTRPINTVLHLPL